VPFTHRKQAAPVEGREIGYGTQNGTTEKTLFGKRPRLFDGKTLAPSLTVELEQHPIHYRIVVADADFAKSYATTSMPVTLLIDRGGRIADAHVGIVVKEAWEEEIRQLLQETQDTLHSGSVRHPRLSVEASDE
jgi:hypothetical protein